MKKKVRSCSPIHSSLKPFVDSRSLAGAVTLVADRTQVRSLEAIGFADVARRRLLKTDALFWIASQTTLDPHFIRSFVAGPTWEIGSIAALCQVTLDQYDTPVAKQRFRDLAFTDMVTLDTPPVFLYNLTPNLPMTADLSVGQGIHHPIFGKVLKEKMDRAGIECITRTCEQELGRTREDVQELFQRELAAFVVRQLCGRPASRKTK